MKPPAPGSLQSNARIAGASPRLTLRIAGILYFASLLTAASGEVFLRGWLSLAAGLSAVFGMAVMTLLFYVVFQSEHRMVALLTVFFSLLGLTFEALRLNPRGVDIALVLHGLYCVGLGYLIFSSSALPRFFSLSMVLAGCAWLTYLSPGLSNALSPGNQAVGIVGEAATMVWFVVNGVSARPGKVPAGAVGVWR